MAALALEPAWLHLLPAVVLETSAFQPPGLCLSLSGSSLLHLYLSWVPSLCFLVVFQVQDTSSSFGNNAMSGTQVAALFIGMETERGYRRRA